jgi:hypothetical protein
MAVDVVTENCSRLEFQLLTCSWMLWCWPQVLAAAGAVDHDQLVKLASEAFGTIPDEDADTSVSALITAVSNFLASSRHAATSTAADAASRIPSHLIPVQLQCLRGPRCGCTRVVPARGTVASHLHSKSGHGIDWGMFMCRCFWWADYARSGVG